MVTWLGTKEIEFIWHGEWADPELRVGDNSIDLWSIEDFCVMCMTDEGRTKEEINDSDIFGKWVRDNECLIVETIAEFSQARNN